MDAEANGISGEESQRNEEFNLMDLNDHCIYTILRKMPIEDLSSVSYTCKKLRQMAFDVVRLNHQDEKICLLTASESKYYRGDDKALANFISCIRNVAIIKSHRTYDNLCNFIKKHCHPNLNSLSLWFLDGETLSPNSLELIADQLRTVKILHMFLHAGSGIYHPLKYCPNIEHLIIDHVNNLHSDWLHHNYPKLKGIYIGTFKSTPEILNPEFIDGFDTLFKNNPNITHLTCDNSSIVEKMLKNVKHIDRLSINVKRLPRINVLQQFVKIGKINWLEIDNVCTLDTAWHSIHELNSIVPINSLFMTTTVPFDSEAILLLENCSHLTRLGIQFCCYPSEQFLIQLIKKSQNVKEILLKFNSSYENQHNLRTILEPFIRNGPKLNKLLLEYKNYDIDQRDLIELNEARMVLDNAVPITIGIRQSYMSQFRKISVFPDLIHPNGCKVKIKKIDMEYNSRCKFDRLDRYILKN